MTINTTAYQTTACKEFVLHKTENALKAAVAAGVVAYVGSDMVSLQDGDAFRDAVPPFLHPFPFQNVIMSAKEAKVPSLAVDVRQFGSWSRQLGKFVVRNEREYTFALLRLRLNHIWINDDVMFLRNVSSIPVKAYSSFISEGLQRQFALDPLEQAKVAILAAIFYNSQFSDEKTLSKDEITHRSGVIAKDTGMNQVDIMAIMDDFPVIHDLTHFCTAVSEVASTVRLQDLSPGLMISILGGGWTGVSYKEMVAVALEHPPTWVAMCYMSLMDRSYRNFRIATIVERHGKGDADKRFTNSLVKMVEAMAPLNAQ